MGVYLFFLHFGASQLPVVLAHAHIRSSDLNYVNVMRLLIYSMI